MSQVQGLKDQLSKLESTTHQHSEKKWKQDDERSDYYQRLDREIEYLRSELNKTKCSDRSDDIVKHIEKSERQKDYLSDHNQVNFYINHYFLNVHLNISFFYLSRHSKYS